MTCKGLKFNEKVNTCGNTEDNPQQQLLWSDPVVRLDGTNDSGPLLSDVENELIAQTLLAVQMQDSANSASDSPAFIRQRPTTSKGPTTIPKGALNFKHDSV